MAHSGSLRADSYLNLYFGRYIWQHGLPDHEVFTSADSGRALLDQQWLAHLAFYGTWRLGGYPGVVLLSAALVAGALALLAGSLVHQRVPGRIAALWTLVAAGGCLSNTVPRAQSFAYPLFVVTIAVVFSDSRAERWRPRLLLLVPFLCLWANLHGSVLLGVAIVAGYAGYRAFAAVSRADRFSLIGYAGLGVGALASLLATPYGVQSINYYSSVFGNPTLTHSITEWRPPSWGDSVSLLYFVTTILVVLIAVSTSIAKRRLPALIPTLVVLALFALSVRAVRNEIWFVLAATMWAAVLSSPARPTVARASRRTFRAPMTLVTGLLLVGGFATILGQSTAQFESGISRNTLAAADAASKTAGGPILADELQSTALLWLRSDTARRVAYDIRFEEYSSVELGAYIHFLDGDRGALSFASRYRVVLLSRNDHSKLLGLLEHSPEWQIGSESKQAILFTRPAAA